MMGCDLFNSEEKEEQPDSVYMYEFSGGDASTYNTTKYAYSKRIRGISQNLDVDFDVGNAFFHLGWVQSPASTSARDGLGPMINARACASCHSLDGRGQPPEANKEMFSMLLRLSIPGKADHGGNIPDPNYGGQINNDAITGVLPEAMPTVSYEEIKGQYNDGREYSLRKPTYHINELAYGDLHSEIMVSPRVAPMMIGMGLLEAIPEATLDSIAAAQATDASLGISGRKNMVWSVRNNKKMVGRLGWKANQPTVEQQVAGAFLGDMGITSPLFPTENCTDVQKACKNAISGVNEGDAGEINEDGLRAVKNYARTLAVPVRRNLELAEVREGAKLFERAKCFVCHSPQLRTGEYDIPQIANQIIAPYTDLLLHDMGDGLADGRPDFDATGKEWKTPPLWGVGMQKKVNGHTTFLHDGRARNLEEAILWHDGEAKVSKDEVLKMTANEVNALVSFLNSL